MNRARRHAEALREVSAFLEIGARECEPDGFSLSRLMWERLLDELEGANVCSGQNSLCAEGISAYAQVKALNHYHRVYATASSLVPLSLSQWKRWEQGLSTLCLGPASSATSCGEGGPSTSTSVVSQTRQVLLAARDEAFAVNYWGTTWSTEVRLEKIAKECRDRSPSSFSEGGKLNREAATMAEGSFKGDESHSEDMLARLTRLNFDILQGFSLLRFQSEHLYSIYPAIGAVERSWLLDKLLPSCEGSAKEYEEAVESMVRQSFKRDFRIPSSDIASGSLLRQYCDFEVDKKKEAELKAILHNTQKSTEYHIATEFAQHEAAVVLALRRGKRESLDEEDALVRQAVLNAKGTAMADEWVAFFRKSSNSGSEACERRVFSFTLRRLIELERFPCVLNPSRLEFCLHLLQRWLPAYCARQHRWTVHDPFVCPEDSDLFEFLLGRHEVLLRWALSSLVPSPRYTAAVAMPPSTVPFVACLEVLRVVAWSLVHTWQSYLKVVRDTPTAGPKRCARERVAKGHLQRWLREKFIALFCKAFLNDLHMQFGDGDDSFLNSDMGSGGEMTKEKVRQESRLADTGSLLILESDLKLLICDLQQSTHEFTLSLWDETRHRLDPLLDEIISFLEAESSTSLTLDMLRGILHAAVRVLSRMQLCLSQSVQRSRGEYAWGDRACVQKLHTHYKCLARKVTLAENALLLNAVFDGWTQLASLKPGMGSEEDFDAQGLLFLYCTKPCTGHASTALCEGFMDVCCERRRAMKRLGAGIAGGTCGSVPSSFSTTCGSGVEDDDHIRSRKRPRK